MYTEDHLLRMIHRLAEAVGRWSRGGAPADRAELEGFEIRDTPLWPLVVGVGYAPR